MALSEEEQRLLAQMEAALAEDDPHLAHTLGGRPAAVTIDKRQATIAVVGFLAGIALLVTGMITHFSICLVGFAVMLVAVLSGFRALHRLQPNDDEQPTVSHAYSASRTRGSFMDRMEEQWRRRMEEQGRS